jgi:hypothetical protein
VNQTAPAARNPRGQGSSSRPVPRHGRAVERHVRNRWSLPAFSFVATMSIVLVSIADTSAPAVAVELAAPGATTVDSQEFTASGAHSVTAELAAYDITEPPPPPPPVAAPAARAGAPAAGTPDPGSAKAIAAEMVAARGWGTEQYDCLVALWQKESSWNVYAYNASSGAYGIPQSLPGSKMATVGADWQTNPATQITWGLNYIQGRYGDPCGAYASSQSRGWY